MKSLTRRRVVLFGAAVTTLISSTVRNAIGRDAGDEFVIVNGWVLRKDDLRPR